MATDFHDFHDSYRYFQYISPPVFELFMSGRTKLEPAHCGTLSYHTIRSQSIDDWYDKARGGGGVFFWIGSFSNVLWFDRVLILVRYSRFTEYNLYPSRWFERHFGVLRILYWRLDQSVARTISWICWYEETRVSYYTAQWEAGAARRAR